MFAIQNKQNTQGQLRLLDQDMIRLQQKVNTVLELQEKEVIDEKENDKKRTRTRRAK